MPSFWHLGVRLGSFSRASNGQDLPIAFPRFGLGRILSIGGDVFAPGLTLRRHAFRLHHIGKRECVGE